MKRTMIGSLALLGLMMGFSTGRAADEKKDKEPSIKDIMVKINGHDEAKGLLDTVKEQLKKKDKADWGKIAAAAKEITPEAELMTKVKPAKGDPKSWAKFAAAYAESAKALEAAAEKKDVDEANAALKKGLTSCAPCHKAHKGK